jgi:hypothetical protein
MQQQWQFGGVCGKEMALGLLGLNFISIKINDGWTTIFIVKV